MQSDTQRTTLLLARVAEGDACAVDELIPQVYESLRKIAADAMRRERSDHTLQPTALANEAIVQLLGGASLEVKNRAHFLAIAARCMRRVLVNHALARRAEKRGGGEPVLSLNAEPAQAGSAPLDLLALEDALATLATLDARKAAVVEQRYFGGMTAHETAQALGVSVSTVEADWRSARAWLASQLSA